MVLFLFCCGLVVLWVYFCVGSGVCLFGFWVFLFGWFFVFFFNFFFSSFKTLWLHGNYINILGNNSEEPCEAVSNFLDKLGG